MKRSCLVSCKINRRNRVDNVIKRHLGNITLSIRAVEMGEKCVQSTAWCETGQGWPGGSPSPLHVWEEVVPVDGVREPRHFCSQCPPWLWMDLRTRLEAGPKVLTGRVRISVATVEDTGATDAWWKKLNSDLARVRSWELGRKKGGKAHVFSLLWSNGKAIRKEGKMPQWYFPMKHLRENG